MSERERFAARREAAADTVHRARPDDDRYRSALERYLTALGRPAADQLEPPPGTASQPAGTANPASPAAAPLSPTPWTNTPVRDVMTANVIVVDEDATFKHITHVLTENRVSAVPVVDRMGRVLGIVSESDLLAKVAAGGDPHAKIGGHYPERQHLRRKAQGETARDMMTAPAVTVSPEDVVVDAARVAARAHVRRLPVVDDRGILVGIVSRTDLLRVFLKSDEALHDYIADEVLSKRFLLEPGSVVVTVADGVVTLRGQVETKMMLEPLLDNIRSLDGVVAVHTDLTYQAEYPTTSTSLIYPPPQFRAP